MKPIREMYIVLGESWQASKTMTGLGLVLSPTGTLLVFAGLWIITFAIEGSNLLNLAIGIAACLVGFSVSLFSEGLIFSVAVKRKKSAIGTQLILRTSKTFRAPLIVASFLRSALLSLVLLVLGVSTDLLSMSVVLLLLSVLLALGAPRIYKSLVANQNKLDAPNPNIEERLSLIEKRHNKPRYFVAFLLLCLSIPLMFLISVGYLGTRVILIMVVLLFSLAELSKNYLVWSRFSPWL